jgi:hypothetical protein
MQRSLARGWRAAISAEDQSSNIDIASLLDESNRAVSDQGFALDMPSPEPLELADHRPDRSSRTIMI